MFHLHNGRLRLEKLEFLLHPQQSAFNSQAVIDVAADGQVTLEDCVVTLEEQRPVRLAMAVLSDPSNVMKMVDSPLPQAQAPLLHLDRCFVRGEGDLVAVRASR